MALFSLWILPSKRRGRRIAAGYQNLYNDKGNWTGCNLGLGLQSGTQMSLSACWLTGELGHQVTAQEMLNMTRAQAEAYYKSGFWDKVQGDSINSQILAEFLGDMRSSAGYNGVKEFQKALNSLGYNIALDGRIGNQALTAINNAVSTGKEGALYNAFRNNMIAYYRRIGTGSNAQFLNGWLRSLDEDYPAIMNTQGNPNTSPNTSNSGSSKAVLGLLALAAGYFIYKKSK